jgi:8-oxo-dGTP diphosphatase
MELNHFNIRVYAIIFNDKRDSILVSDEFQRNMRMTKFPGGGLKLGEGTLDCLRREAIEEFGQEINIISHFYTTDFFQKALFYEDMQLISIYYVAAFKEPPKFKISILPFDFGENENGKQSFRWIKIKDIDSSVFTLPIDQKVGEMLVNWKI